MCVTWGIDDETLLMKRMLLECKVFRTLSMNIIFIMKRKHSRKGTVRKRNNTKYRQNQRTSVSGYTRHYNMGLIFLNKQITHA